MSKKHKHKKQAVPVAHIYQKTAPISSDDIIKQATITDLKKTAVLITLLFALEFLIFYANLMGVGA